MKILPEINYGDRESGSAEPDTFSLVLGRA